MSNSNDTINSAVGVQGLELALARELAAWRDWDLRVASKEISTMRRIQENTNWSEEFLPLVDKFSSCLAMAEKTVSEKDTTLITAAQTNLEAAVFALRDQLFR